MPHAHTPRALLALLVLSLIWGLNWIVMKQVVAYVDPFDFTAMRTVLGAAALFGLLAVLGKPWRPGPVAPLMLLGLLQTGLFSLLIQLAVVYGGAGKAAVITYTMPFWLLLLAWPLLGERVRGAQWAAVAFAALGLGLIIAPAGRVALGAGSLLPLAAGLIWALSAVLAKRIQARTPLDVLSMTAWQMLFGALALCVVTPFLHQRPLLPTPYFFGALAFNALCATASAWLLWLYALRHLSAGVAGLTSLATPALSVALAWWLLGEVPSSAEQAGMVLIVAALGMLSLLAIRAHRLAART